MKMTFQVKIVIALLVSALLFVGLQRTGHLPGMFVTQSAVPVAVELPTSAPVQAPAETVAKVALPSTTVVTKGFPIRANIWAWNAQMGLIFANGGPQTTAGSLMEKNGIRLTLNRQDDTTKTKPELVKFAEAVARGDSNPAVGVHYMIIMGDGLAAQVAGLNDELKKLGPDYYAEAIGAVGYSGNEVSGEDTLMGPEEWKDNPQSMRGAVIAGVIGDGDWNIAMDYMQKNGIPNNPDVTTYDPDAVNWLGTDDYTKAALMAVNHVCSDRKEVKNGKLTGNTVNKCATGGVTWTPGDVTMAKKGGGFVKVWSTKENYYQMPSVVVGIHAWNEAHPNQVAAFLDAAFAGSEQVRTYPEALDRAGKASFAVYNEETPGYWVKYYRGVVERDAKGQMVPLGGSRVANLTDNLILFGLAPGAGGEANSLFNATYTGFARVFAQQYPKLLPSFPPVEKAVNTRFLKMLEKKYASAVTEVPQDAPKFEDSTPIETSNVVASKNWNIQFDTGKATFTPAAEATLSDLYNQLVLSAKLKVEIDGHTDNVGNPEANKALSEARAFAVKQWLEAKSSTLFPENRVVIRSYGDTNPIASNSTPEGRAKNRRVTIILGLQ